MNKILTSLLIAATIPLAACTHDSKTAEKPNQNPLVFKYSENYFQGFKKISDTHYRNTDKLGNAVTLNVSKNNKIRSVTNNSAAYKHIEECRTNYKKVLSDLDYFVNNSNEHLEVKKTTMSDVTLVRYQSNEYTVTKSLDCYPDGDIFVYFASIVNNGQNNKAVWKEFSNSMSQNGSRVYKSATSPSTWLTYPQD
jgi:hypothetical protein